MGTAPLPAPPAGSPPWWTRPHVFLLTVTVPVFSAILLSADRIITRNSAGYDSPDFITPFFVALSFAGLAALGLAAWTGARLPATASTLRIGTPALDALFWATVAAYAVWFGPLVARQPGLVIGALTGSAGATYSVRELDLNISGVTTATQFAITYVCLYATKRFSHGERLPWRHAAYLAVLLGLALFRAIVNSERIALLEVVFPLVVVVARTPSRWPWPVRAVLWSFPLLTIFGSTALFAAFEYNRSWLIHYQYQYDSLMDFAAERLSIYFVSSFNNICGFMAHTPWPSHTGNWTFAWAFRLPGLGPLLSGFVPVPRGEQFGDFLAGAADKEFNNTTGLLTVFDDWGIAGGLVFMAVLGFAMGRGWRSYASGRGVMQYAYPILFYHLYEILRIGYVFDGRGMAGLIGLALVVAVWGRRQGTQGSPGPVGAPITAS